MSIDNKDGRFGSGTSAKSHGGQQENSEKDQENSACEGKEEEESRGKKVVLYEHAGSTTIMGGEW